MKRIVYLILVLLAFALGIGLTYQWMKPQAEIVETNSTLLLEEMKKVCKLVTVERNFNQIYKENNIRKLTVYLPFPTSLSSTKEASIRLNGKLLVGYDLESVRFDVDSVAKIVRVSNLPEPKILAIDHDIVFENLEEGWFNGFSKEDYTQLSKNAKEEIKNRMATPELLDEVRQEGNHLLDILQLMVENAGWQFETNQTPEDILKN